MNYFSGPVSTHGFYPRTHALAFPSFHNSDHDGGLPRYPSEGYAGRPAPSWGHGASLALPWQYHGKYITRKSLKYVIINIAKVV